MNRTHGHYAGGKASATYTSWQNMRTRCNNANDPAYPAYGGRGIKVCKRWGKFENFIADMGVRPQGHTLDRVDSSKGYYKANCRWATPREQAENRRTSRIVPHMGREQCIAAWAREAGMHRSTLRRRLDAGIDPSTAVSLPPHPTLHYRGQTKSISAWAREYGLNRTTLDERIRRGWSAHRALTTPVGGA